MDDVSSEVTTRAFEYWGAFAFVLVLSWAVIWWLLQHIKSIRAAYQKVIDDLNAERKYWVDTAFTATRETSQQSADALAQVTQAVAQTERLVDLLKALQREK